MKFGLANAEVALAQLLDYYDWNMPQEMVIDNIEYRMDLQSQGKMDLF